MEIKTYIMLFNRWVRIFVLVAIIGGVMGYVGSQLVTPSYRASTKIMIFRTQEDENENTEFAFLNNKQLVQTYLELLKSAPLLEETSNRLNHNVKSNENVRISQIEDTQFIRIRVEGPDPQRAALIANTLVDVLIEQNENIQTNRFLTTEDNLNRRKTQIENQILELQTEFNEVSEEDIQTQLLQVNNQIATLGEEITTLYREIAELGPEASFLTVTRIELADKEARLSQIQPLLLQYQEIRTNLELLRRPNNSGPDQETLRLDRLQTTIDLYQKVRLDILKSIESIQLLRLQSTPNIVQIETASVPANPFRPVPLLFVLLGGAVGLGFAVAGVYLIESLDNSLKTVEDVQQILNLPVIGFIYAEESKAPPRWVNWQKFVLRLRRMPANIIKPAGSADDPIYSPLVNGSRTNGKAGSVATNGAAVGTSSSSSSPTTSPPSPARTKPAQ